MLLFFFFDNVFLLNNMVKEEHMEQFGTIEELV